MRKRNLDRKSPGRLKSDLWKKLRPEVDLATLGSDISEFLDKHAGKSTPNQNLANNLAAYLTQKYSVSDQKAGQLRRLIEHHSDDVAAFLDEISSKEGQALIKTLLGHPQPTSFTDLWKALLTAPDKLPPSQNEIPLPDDDPLRRKKRRRPRPKTETERLRRRKEATNRYEERRREYRRGLIVEQFGTYPFQTFYPHERTPPEGAGLDVLLNGGAVRMAGQRQSLEDLFGVDRHRFPKPLLGKRRGSKVVYDLAASVECIIHLLDNRDGKEQWLPKGAQRHMVLTGIIARARRYSPEVGDMLAEKLRPYVP